MRPSPAYGLALDLAIVAAIAALAVFHLIPGEVALTVLASLLGARLRGRLGGGPGAGGSGSTGNSTPPPAAPPPLQPPSLKEVSFCAALAWALLALAIPHHDGGSAA